MRYYVIESMIMGEHGHAYTYGELIKAVRRYKYRDLYESLSANDIWRFNHLYYSDVEDVDDITHSNCHKVDDTFKRNLKLDSDLWWDLQKEKYDKWDLNYMVQTDALGRELGNGYQIDLWPNYHLYRPSSKPVSHSCWKFKHGRAGNKANHKASVKANILYKEYASLPKMRHRDRKRDCNFYCFDDPAYITSHHSTGWKYSTKNKHQYESKVKRQLRQLRKSCLF